MAAARGKARPDTRRAGPHPAQGERMAPAAALAPSILVATCAILVGIDAFRLGFFADDFHFLDVARRLPTLDVLLGRYGVWPWYRPLSRELYFWLAVAAGPWGLMLTRALGIACFAGATLLVHRLGLRLMSPAAAAAAALLFATCSLSKLLVAWASGFQDVLATLLTVGAVLAHASGRRNHAVLLAVLAPFAKESGFLAAPLVVAWSLIVEGRRRFEPWMARQGAAVLVALAIHVAVRATWSNVYHPAPEPGSAADLGACFLGTLASFVTARVPRDPLTWLAGLAVGACAAFLLMAARVGGPDRVPAGPGRGAGFLALATLIGAAPVLAMHFVGLYAISVRLLYPAVPWLALLFASALARVPTVPWRPALAALVLVNAWGLGYQTPDLDTEAGWKTGTLDWTEGQRIWARTERLAGDLRAALADRPESLVVLYVNLPSGSWFQTEDGPAAREVLADPTVRTYFANKAPRGIPRERMAMIVGDPVGMHHVGLFPSDSPLVFARSAGALLRGRHRSAYYWATYASPLGVAPFFTPFLRAAAVLGEEGVPGYARELAAAGVLRDSVLARPPLLEALANSPQAGLAPALALALRRPLTAAAHLECGDSLERRGAPLLAGVELTVASRLAPSSGIAHARLGLLLARNRLGDLARAELEQALALGLPADVAATARAVLAAQGAGGAGSGKQEDP